MRSYSKKIMVEVLTEFSAATRVESFFSRLAFVDTLKIGEETLKVALRAPKTGTNTLEGKYRKISGISIVCSGMTILGNSKFEIWLVISSKLIVWSPMVNDFGSGKDETLISYCGSLNERKDIFPCRYSVFTL